MPGWSPALAVHDRPERCVRHRGECPALVRGMSQIETEPHKEDDALPDSCHAGCVDQAEHRRLDFGDARAPRVGEALSVRTAIFDLQTAGPGVASLRGTLNDAISELTADAPLRTTVRMSGPLDVVPPELAEHAEAVVREAVSNAVRHARATELVVTVSVADDLTIDVLENGIGIPETVARSGLHNLERRAAQAGGVCQVSRVDGGGTRLVWSAPVP